uniref:Uncharacterized protein n=1 Tax=Oryza nivara TaxID=4536 RepID=A0A0E0IFV9_ORYNI
MSESFTCQTPQQKAPKARSHRSRGLACQCRPILLKPISVASSFRPIAPLPRPYPIGERIISFRSTRVREADSRRQRASPSPPRPPKVSGAIAPCLLPIVAATASPPNPLRLLPINRSRHTTRYKEITASPASANP